MGKPTEKMVKYAERLAKENDLELHLGYDEDIDVCRKFLNEHGNVVRPPSEKQLAYAKSIEANTGRQIPRSAYDNSKELGEYIDMYVSSATAYKLSEKQRNVLNKNLSSLDGETVSLLTSKEEYSRVEYDMLKSAIDNIFANMNKPKSYELSEKQIAILASPKNANSVSKRVKELVIRGGLSKEEFLECKQALDKIFASMPPKK